MVYKPTNISGGPHLVGFGKILMAIQWDFVGFSWDSIGILMGCSGANMNMS